MIYLMRGRDSYKANTLQEMQDFIKKVEPSLELLNHLERYPWGEATNYGNFLSKKTGIEYNYWTKYDGRSLKGIKHVRTYLG